MIQKNKVESKLENRKWLIFSLGAFLAWGNLALVSKYLINQGIPVTVTLFYWTFIVSILIFIESKVRRIKININNNTLLIFLLMGVSSTLFNLFMQVGYIYSPNPGYINAANASSISLLTLLSAFFFKDELNSRKVVGVLGVTAGLILLFL